MPPFSMMTYPWLKQIIKGDKKLLNASEVRICNPPRYDEISVARLYETCIKMPGMADYFPDKYPKNRQAGRIYFFSVLSTLHREYTDKLLMQSKQVRFAGDDEDQVKQTIEVSDEWAE